MSCPLFSAAILAAILADSILSATVLGFVVMVTESFPTMVFGKAHWEKGECKGRGRTVF